VAEFCGLMQSGHPQFETSRSAPVFFRGWAMTILISDHPVCSRSVPNVEYAFSLFVSLRPSP
jgi:hypothetical protein